MIPHILIFGILLAGTIGVANAESVPEWVKNTAGWWATDVISENEFLSAIEFLANEGIISVKDSMSSKQKIQKLFDESIYKIPETQSYAAINSYGFRGSEITKEKPENVFRIFAVGGSTTFSVGVEDEFAWPFLLEKEINKLNPTSEVQVINAGISGASSFSNSKLIKQKLVQFEPDLIIMYEGVNDQDCLMPPYHNKNTFSTPETIIQNCGVFSLQDYPTYLAERYSKICGFGKQNNFEVIVVFQPTIKLDGKILTNQELDSYFDRPQYPILLEDYNVMVQETLEGIAGCEKTADLTEVFDSYNIPIYHDYHHVGDTGNSIIADKIRDLVIPSLINKEIIIENEKSVSNISDKKLFGLKNMKNADFSNKIISNESFFATDLRNSDFSNSELDMVDLRLSNLEGASFKNSKLKDVNFRQNMLKNADFSNVDFKNVDLMNVDLSYTNMENTDLENKNLQRTFFHKSNLSGANLSGSKLDNSFLHGTNLSGADLTQASLLNVDFTMIENKDFSTTKIDFASLAFADLSGVKLPNKIYESNMYNTKLDQVDLSNAKIIGTFFESSSIKNSDLSNADFRATINTAIIEDAVGLNPIQIGNKISDFPTIKIINVIPNGNNVQVEFIAYNNFIKADLQNTNMQNGKFVFADFKEANLTNTDLSYSNLEGANLEGANLEGANLEGANLEGANLEGANLNCINHEICN